MMKTRLLTTILLLFTTLLSAQDDFHGFYNVNEAWQGSLNVGINSFWGDVNDGTNKIFPTTPFQSSFYQQRCFVLGGFFGKRMTPFWNLNLEFKLSNLAGKNYKTSMQFYSRMNNEIVLTSTFDILKLCRKESYWSVYPKIGFGVYGFKSRRWNPETGNFLQAFPVSVKDDAEEIPTEPTHLQYTFAIPFGVGVGYRILPELNLFFETSMTWVNTDFLDAYQSNDKHFEGVWTSSIGVSYQFDFPVVRRKARHGSYKVYDPALKDDHVNDRYQRMERKCSVIHKPVKSHSKSSVKSKKAKRKQFSM